MSEDIKELRGIEKALFERMLSILRSKQEIGPDDHDNWQPVQAFPTSGEYSKGDQHEQPGKQVGACGHMAWAEG